MHTTSFDEKDRLRIERHGLSIAQAETLVRQLGEPARHVKLLRAATRTDGVTSLVDVDALASRFGQLSEVPGKFVPMSGAASRMFAFLDRVLKGGPRPGDDKKVDLFISGLQADGEGPRFAFVDELSRVLAREDQDLHTLIAQDQIKPIIAALLEPKGLDYRRTPKALVLFHHHQAQARTALEEHLREALRYAGGQLHYTLSPEHRDRFANTLQDLQARAAELAQVQISDSVQHPSTDSLALDARTGELIRDELGQLVFFPAGHGSLLLNLQQLGRPVVLRNVDNVPRPQAARDQIDRYHRALAVLLADLKSEISKLLAQLDRGKDLQAIEPAIAALRQRGLFVHLAHEFEGDDESRRRQLRKGLDRPLKIVGLVRNEGEPGGGPFVILVDGIETVSIVEKDEIAAEQKQLMHEGEFFNPVDLVLDPTRADGQPYDLQRFVNNSRPFVVRKTYRGRDVLRLEHPGLWNGAMDGWNSLFVELPIETFAPVKEVVDLLRPNHQP